MDRIVLCTCNHPTKEIVDDDIEKCKECGEELCRHSQIDPQSNCIICGEYVQEISNDVTWKVNTYTFGNQTAKSIDHTKFLKNLGFNDEIIDATIKKYSDIDNRMKNEIPIIAACTFLSLIDVRMPKTIKEIADIFSTGPEKITRSKLQKSLKCVYEIFPEYATKYITVAMMIKPLMNKLSIHERYYPYIYEIAKFVQKNWSECEGSKRSTPQNIASVIIFKYIFKSPTLKQKFTQPEVIKILKISKITCDNIIKILEKLVDW